MYKKLFSPCKIKGLTLKNRVIMPAMGTRMADETSHVTQRLIDYHAARAKGGCGLNIVEVSSVQTLSAPAHFVSISEDEYVEGHKALVDAIHQNGGKAGIQLWQGSIAVSMDPKAKMYVVSDMNMGPFSVPAITKEEINEIVGCFGKAAKRAALAGYDCVEFHCAHNYLPHSFLSAGFNHREDEYGGSFENRARFPLECIKAIKENLPSDMPIFMRIDAHDDYLPNGLTIEEVIAFCKLAGQAGVDVLDISRGNIITAASLYEVPPIDVERGFNVENAARIRKETGMLTIAVGRINTPKQAEEILEEDKADLIVMGRAQLADPEFCNKAQNDKDNEIVHCIGCNQGCYDGFCDVVNRPFITCLRNPMLGHEGEIKIEPTTTPKNVWIVGGGMAGLECAKILKQKHHNPIIFEEKAELGGQFLTAGEAPGKAEMKQAAISFGEQVMNSGVQVRFGVKINPKMIEEEKPDTVVFAIGASPIDLHLEHSDLMNVLLAHDVLDGKVEAKGNVGVIGGGLVGLEVADYLASKGHQVSVIEMLDAAGKDLGSLRKIAVMSKMAQLKVNILTNTKSKALNKNGIVCERDGKEELVACDSVVMAVGSRSNDSSELIKACKQHNIPYYVIGDALKARRALNAVEEGFKTALEIK
ncbi:MAG: FAD-dependent oxidoreductase [Erysipelotrichaceae bacterium]